MLGTIVVVAYIRGCRQPWLPLQLATVGYTCAWIGHYVFEQNRPATFVYPSYSLACDFIMWFQTLTGQIPFTKHL